MLRGREAGLREIKSADLDGVVRRSIRREALLAWKGRIETLRPELLYEREEIERKVTVLGTLDHELRAHNKELLRLDIDPGRLGTAAGWGRYHPPPRAASQAFT